MRTVPLQMQRRCHLWALQESFLERHFSERRASVSQCPPVVCDGTAAGAAADVIGRQGTSLGDKAQAIVHQQLCVATQPLCRSPLNADWFELSHLRFVKSLQSAAASFLYESQ